MVFSVKELPCNIAFHKSQVTSRVCLQEHTVQVTIAAAALDMPMSHCTSALGKAPHPGFYHPASHDLLVSSVAWLHELA